MTHCRTKKRVCFVNNLVLFKKNVGISQPKDAPCRPLRSRFHDGTNTVNPSPHTTLDNLFSSDGFGQPKSANRKQTTFNVNKTEINSTSPNIQQISTNKQDITTTKNKQNYKQGFMYKSQADVESNVGSMDRLQRLKAKQIRDYSIY